MEKQTKARKPRHPAVIYLSEYRCMKQRMEALKEELAYIRENAVRVTALMSSEKVKGSAPKDRVGEAAVRAVDMERKLCELIEHQNECLEMRLTLIEAMDNENEKTLLTLRYIRCLKWEDIEYAMNYGATAVYELHARALQSFWTLHGEIGHPEKEK